MWKIGKPQIWKLLVLIYNLNRSCSLQHGHRNSSIRKDVMNTRVLTAFLASAQRGNTWFTAARKDELWRVHPLFQQHLRISGKQAVYFQRENKSDENSMHIDFLTFSRTLLQDIYSFPYDIAAEAGSPGPVRDGEVSGRQWFLRDCTV